MIENAEIEKSYFEDKITKAYKNLNYMKSNIFENVITQKLSKNLDVLVNNISNAREKYEALDLDHKILLLDIENAIKTEII